MELKGKVVVDKEGRFFYEGNEKEKQYLIRRGLATHTKEGPLLSNFAALLLWDVFSVPSPRQVFEQPLHKYVVFRDLFLKGFKFISSAEGTSRPLKTYSSSPISYEGVAKVLHCDGNFTAIEGDARLYEDFWFGQKGIYKKGKGNLFLLDAFEAKYLKQKKLLKGRISNDLEHFKDYYSVYKEWRDAGFVLKTGFKFGGDFRIYPKGTSPKNITHSKHILHVFPQKLVTTAENWSRSIRVCHGVRKTYLLAVPSERKGKFEPDFVVSKDGLQMVVKVIKQSERIDGEMLHSALAYCLRKKTDLLIAIVDRETSTTYYRAKRVVLEGSKTLYYEVEWMNLK